ncbi:MAG: hypothetical protein GYB65_13985 [Chloroflexi bacterium]|nr:hypothetical protein [Chloroflexota bacterium]
MMLEEPLGQSFLSLAELNHLRTEAMALFEQSLTSGDSSGLIAFIEHQLSHEPPRIELLRELADDLQLRLLSLREYHFDVRERVVRMLKESYNVDVTTLTPPARLSQYHTLRVDDVLSLVRASGIQLNDQETALLQKMVDASLKMAAQLYNDIQLTATLHQMVIDWLDAMQATIAKRYWNHGSDGPPHPPRH